MATTMTLLRSLPFGSSLPFKSLSDLRSIPRNLSPSMATSMAATSEQTEEKTTRKKVFVAGSTGRTGRRIVEQLLSRGYGVRAGALDLDKARNSLPKDSNVEFGVTGCRSFTLIAVAGSIIGSILCFVEGCFFVLEAFYQYFQTISSSTNQGRIMQSLVESIDMFLVGTAPLSFGISLYVMFVSSDDMKQKKRRQIAESTFGSFNLKKLAKSMGMQSISDAKSRHGHSILLILQAGMVEKLKEVELVSGMDLACFAGAVFVSSACVFILSKLSIPRGTNAFST